MSTTAINDWSQLVEIEDVAGCLVLKPAEGATTQGFGITSVTGSIHRGIDTSCATGTKVKAAANGWVGYTYTNGWDAPGLSSDGSPGNYGNQVRLTHPWGETRYAHLSRVDVYVGQQITAGQVLGLSGTTGMSSGPHLHWELREHRGWAFNPYDNGYIGAFVPAPPPPPPPLGQFEEWWMDLSPEQQGYLLAQATKANVDAADFVKRNKGNLSPLAIAAEKAGFTQAMDAPGKGAVDIGINRLREWFEIVMKSTDALHDVPDAQATIRAAVLDLQERFQEHGHASA